MICPRCGGTMEQKMKPYVTKRKKEGEGQTIGSELVWFCRDCKITAEIKPNRE